MDHDHTVVVSQSALEIVSGLREMATGVWSTLKVVHLSKQFKKEKALVFSSLCAFAVGVTRHLKMFLAFSFFIHKVVLTLWLLARNPELSTTYIYL